MFPSPSALSMGHFWTMDGSLGTKSAPEPVPDRGIGPVGEASCPDGASVCGPGGNGAGRFNQRRCHSGGAREFCAAVYG